MAESRSDSDVICIRIGTFGEDPGIRPSAAACITYAAPWEPIPEDGLARFPEARKGRTMVR